MSEFHNCLILEKRKKGTSDDNAHIYREPDTPELDSSDLYLACLGKILFCEQVFWLTLQKRFENKRFDNTFNFVLLVSLSFRQTNSIKYPHHKSLSLSDCQPNIVKLSDSLSSLFRAAPQ